MMEITAQDRLVNRAEKGLSATILKVKEVPWRNAQEQVAIKTKDHSRVRQEF